MPRINTVKAARKAQGKCDVCGKEINAGDAYKWAQPRYRGKIKACPGCTIPLSMLSSSKMVAVIEAVNGIDTSDTDGLADALRDLAETARGVGEEYQESCDNQREYFPDSDLAQENEDKAQGLSDWADSLESAADEIEGLESELDAFKAELDELNEALEGLEERKDGLTDDAPELDELEGEITAKENEITDKENEISDKEQEITDKADEVLGEQP